MLDKQAVDGDVVSVYDEAVLAGVELPTDTVTMVRAPDPGMVHECVVAVNAQIHFGPAHTRAADAEEDIV